VFRSGHGGGRRDVVEALQTALIHVISMSITLHRLYYFFLRVSRPVHVSSCRGSFASQ
jgi:hypothetical protein